MAGGIVEPFEQVDVDHQHGDIGAEPIGAINLHFQPRGEVAAVVEPGERVGDRPVDHRNGKQRALLRRVAVAADEDLLVRGEIRQVYRLLGLRGFAARAFSDLESAALGPPAGGISGLDHQLSLVVHQHDRELGNLELLGDQRADSSEHFGQLQRRGE